MKLPRRVPWSTLAELDEVCSWIYTDENDIDAKVLAVNRLAAWKAITPLPHALEATLSILTAVLQDASSQISTSFLSLRQSYATAIIRLVNGLVDSLQMGAYARSIASLAAQLGLPAWFVELRHSATHEDLPSLEVLRSAAWDAMRWLLNNYFLPSLSPSSSAQPPTEPPTLRPINPLLQRYKSLLKSVTRDASLRTQLKTEIAKILRDIERWIAEAKVAANVSASTFEWESGDREQNDEQDDVREKWVLDIFCDHLLEKGILVPLSKKKRIPPREGSFEPLETTLRIWMPLISHVYQFHRSLPSVLAFKMIYQLTGGSKTRVEDEAETILLADDGRDVTYDICLASWANWLVETYGSNLDDDSEDEERTLRREDAVLSLLSGLRPDKAINTSSEKIARKLLKALSVGYPYLERLVALVASSSKTANSSDWHDEDLAAMSQRLDSALSQRSDAPEAMGVDSAPIELPSPQNDSNSIQLPIGWRKGQWTGWLETHPNWGIHR